MYYSWYLCLILLLLCSIETLGDLSLFLQDVLKASTRPIAILPVNALGLANRLRIISSAYSIVSSRNASLVVIWGANEDCDISFEELFTSSTIRVYNVPGTIDGFDRYIRRSVNEIIHKTQVSIQEIYPRSFHLNTDWTSTRISILWTRGTHADIDTLCGEYLHNKRQFYQQLQPTKTIQNMIDRILPMFYNGGMVVGVHIRAFDERYDWAVVSPSWTSSLTTATVASADSSILTTPTEDEVIYQLQSKRFDEAASLHSFITFMTELLAVHPNMRFFVASNSILAKNNIVQHFGRERIITLDEVGNTGQRDTHDSILAAAAEFWLLGETAFVIHTRGSSFAREAASRANIPVLDASVEHSGVHVTTDDAVQSVQAMVPLYFFSVWEALPHCGMPEFIRVAYTSARQGSETVESTAGDSVDGSVGSAKPNTRSSGVNASAEGSAQKVQPVSTAAYNSNRKVCYQEDDRVICTVAYTVCPCSSSGSSSSHREGYSGGFSHLLGLRIGHMLHCYVDDPAAMLIVGQAGCVSILAESNGYSL